LKFLCGDKETGRSTKTENLFLNRRSPILTDLETFFPFHFHFSFSPFFLHNEWGDWRRRGRKKRLVLGALCVGRTGYKAKTGSIHGLVFIIERACKAFPRSSGLWKWHVSRCPSASFT